MNTLLNRRLANTLFVALLFSLHFPFTASADDADWNVAVLDQLIASVPAGQTFAQVDDMMVPVSYLQSWRNKLAGGPQPNVAFSGTFTVWPGGNIYYAFDASVSAPNQKAFLDAAAEWATFVNLHFIVRTSQANYVVVTNNASLNGGLSAVGMIGGPQLLQIGPNAWNRGTLCHEIGHVLGLVHEHQRSDRDNYVTILSNNVSPGLLANFVKLTDSQNKTAYDFYSVMHYSRNAFSTNPAVDTIEPLPAYAPYLNIMGRQFDPVLSAGDRAAVIAVYGAGSGATNIVSNTQDGGPGSLRAALYYAFDHPGTAIAFNIPVTDPGLSNSVFNIQPSDALPGLWGNTTLDATTEPTNSNPIGPEILLNGVLCHTAERLSKRPAIPRHEQRRARIRHQQFSELRRFDGWQQHHRQHRQRLLSRHRSDRNYCRIERRLFGSNQRRRRFQRCWRNNRCRAQRHRRQFLSRACHPRSRHAEQCG